MAEQDLAKPVGTTDGEDGNLAAEGKADRPSEKPAAGKKKPWRPSPLLIPVLAVIGLVFMGSWVAIFDVLGIDSWMRGKTQDYLHSFVNNTPCDEVVLVMIKDDTPLGPFDESWRGFHAEMITALSSAGARVLAFDFFFQDPSDHDAHLLEAIAEAATKGTRVVLGTEGLRAEGAGIEPEMVHTLRQGLDRGQWGVIKIGGKLKGSLQPPKQTTLRIIKIAEEIKTEEPGWAQRRDLIPSFALQIVIQYRFPGPLTQAGFTGGGQMNIRDQNGKSVMAIPVDRSLNFHLDTAVELSQPFAYDKVYLNRHDVDFLKDAFAGKIVLFGYLTADDQHQIAPKQNRYGVEIQAIAVANILHQRYVRRLPAFYHFLVIGLLTLAAAALQTFLFRYNRLKISLQKLFGNIPFIPPIIKETQLPVILLAVAFIYLLTVLMIFRNSRFIFDVTYHLFALFLTYWLVGVARQRWQTTRKDS